MLRAPPPRSRVVPNGSEVWNIFMGNIFYDFLGKIFGSFVKKTLLIFQQQQKQKHFYALPPNMMKMYVLLSTFDISKLDL